MKTEFYVYQLIEPDGDVFYVGKGSKLRMYQHVKDIQRGRVPGGNYELGEQIRKILDAGLKVKYKRVLLTYNEQEAYNYEKKVIAEIGLQNLCNKDSGGSGGNSGWTYKHTEKAKRKMSEIGKAKWKERKRNNNPNYLKQIKELRKAQIQFSNQGTIFGYSFDSHCKKIGIPISTAYRWLKYAKEEEFSQAVIMHYL